MVDLTKVQSSSFMPGFQTVGTATATALVSGTMPGSGTAPNLGYLIGTFTVGFPDPTVMSDIRVTLPSGNGDLATKWFPLMGTLELVDFTVGFTLILDVASASNGRLIEFNFVNSNATDYTFTNYPIEVYAHLYTYPF